MKAFVFILICCMSTAGAFSQINYSARFSPADFQIADTLAGDNVTYSYFTKNPFSSVETCGQPMLPVKYQHFIIPYGMKIDSITFAVADTLHENLNNFLFPAQYPVASCVGCPKPPFCNIDSAIYFASTSYPIGNVTPAGQGYWHTANIVTVAVYPYQYLPVSNKIIFSGTINFTIWFSLPAGSSSFPHSKKMRKSKYENFVSSLNHLVSNSINISQYLTGIEVADFLPISVDPPNNEYIVIAPKEFAITEAMEFFVDWKKKRGIDIKVITIEEVYAYTEANSIRVDDIGNNSTNAPNSYNIAGNAAKLRKYLTRVDSLGGAQWILLIGDDSKLPIQNYSAKLDQQLFGLRDVITDKYFADFTSDYNVDGDTKLGEFRYISSGWQGDNVDVFPEAYLGRIPCSSTSEFQIWVNKLLNYETDPGNGSTDYLKRFVLTMADEFQADLQNSTPLINNLSIFPSPTFFKESPDWDDPEPKEPEGNAIISALNTAPSGWWTWSNHGEREYFSTMTQGINAGNKSFIASGNGTNGLLALTNTNKYGIIHSGSCHVAYFPLSTSMVKTAMFNPNGGCVVFSGNSSLGWIDMENAKLINLTGIIKVCTNGSNLYNKNLCVADWNSYSYAGALNETQYETYLTHNYFGDPEMMYYTKAPIRLDALVSPRHIDATQTNTVHIVVKNLANNDTVVVCLYKQAVGMQVEFQKSKVLKGVPGIDTVSFIIPANTLSGNILYVTISGFNYLPFTDEIIVSPGCTYYPNAPEYISGTPLPWSSIRFKDHDVIIDSLATLTISGEVYFVPEARMIVKPGGKLVLNGGKLGTSCEALWKGVEVWGHSNLTQYSNVNQGFIQVTNNGSINDAICAISTAKPTTNSFVAGTSGGMFSCTNASFLNNKCSIHVYAYQHQNDNYNSNISRTSFTLDDKYLGEPDGSPMVLLDGIKGLGMSGLTFDNSRPPGGAPVFRGVGIKAINSGFRLNQICTNANQQPCTEYIKPSFTGLFYGIHCLSTSVAKFVQVEHTNFIGNDRGIYLSAVVNPSITQCYFKTKTGTSILPSSGLYLDHCTGYAIQENSFEGCNNGSTTFDYGIVVNSSGTAPNEIYNNLFSSLQYGIAAQDTNRNPVNGVGLVCKCNDFSNNKTDQAVLIFSSSNTYKGIALYQGDSLSITGPAGNTFSQRSIGSGTYDLYNQGVRFKYYHQPNAQSKRLKPEPQLCTNVYIKQWNAYPYDKTTSCPSKLNSGGSNLEGMKIELQSTSTNVQQKETELQAMVDGGTTVQTTEDIAYSTPSEALLLHDELLMKSPYLSDTVMQSAVANEFVLPNVMIRDILVANPQSASSEPVLNELDKRIEPMPEDMYNQILDAESAYSPLEIREMELASLKAKQSWLFNSVVTNYLSDTTGLVDDSLKVVLQNTPFPEGRYLLALKQMAENDTIAAASTLQSISTSFELNNEQQAIFNDYLNYFEILKEMNRDTLPGTETDSSQTASLLTLMTNINEPVKSYIQNILIANRVITYEEPYLFADELKASRIRKTNLINNEVNAMLQISPNPATGYFIVKYDLNNQIAPATIEVVSLHGQVLLSKQLNKNRDQFVVTLTGFSSGIYNVSIRARDRVLDNCRLIVIK